MTRIMYDMLKLLSCGVNSIQPSKELISRYQTDTERLNKLYYISRTHFVDALTGMVLKQEGVILPTIWEESIAKAIRKVILFDAERAKIFSFMEQNGIWHLPLKGIILKEYYPSIGMRQMSDNDILFDKNFADAVCNYMISIGYRVESFGQSNHDVYEKEPVYNFEMHRTLYGSSHDKRWKTYYKNIKNRLVCDERSSYSYQMTKEDFYIYILSHGYKHYTGSGTGIRTLLDFYVYLQKNEQKMNFSYIERECKKLGIFDFEKRNRILCKKVFKVSSLKSLRKILSEKEGEMLKYYLTSGAYGTMERRVENRLNDYKVLSKPRYILNRLFPRREIYQYYPVVNKHKWLLPGFWIYRMVNILLKKERRENVLREFRIVRKIS